MNPEKDDKVNSLAPLPPKAKRIEILLQDVEPDKYRRSRRSVLDPEQWSQILAADARGISSKTIFVKLSGSVTPFFSNPKSFASALAAERNARKKKA